MWADEKGTVSWLICLKYWLQIFSPGWQQRPSFICTESASVLSDHVFDKSFSLCICTNKTLSKPVALVEFTKMCSSSAAPVKQAEGQFSVIPDQGSIFIIIYTIHTYYICTYVSFKVRVQHFVILSINFCILWSRQVCRWKEEKFTAF